MGPLRPRLRSRRDRHGVVRRRLPRRLAAGQPPDPERERGAGGAVEEGERLASIQRRQTMRFVAAYLMATIGGNASPTKDDVRAILGAVGADIDEDKLGYLFDQVAGKDLAEILAAGSEMLAFGAAPAAAAATAGGAAAAGEKEEEEKVEEKEKEGEDDIVFSLFDDE
uniref:60S acidic ribosomal protein n=4 Tax=Oryza TaxID=4527 RepID=Q6ZL73_ORYSJ|nr:putative 60S acidic ribosomal protein [Oryza sativa Japonica Group]